MQNSLYELDFSEIDLSNPFSISECVLNLKRKNSMLSITDSFDDDSKKIADYKRSLINSKKNNRGRKIDDYDYNAKIQEELEKLGERSTDSSNKKKLIQKIRNKLSANRSRLRSKAEMKALKEENAVLKEINEDLQQQLEVFTVENKELITKMFKNEVINMEINYNAENQDIVRNSYKSEKAYLKNLFFITAILLKISLVPPMSTDKIKLSGVVPLISLKKPVQKLRNSQLEDTCKTGNFLNNSLIDPNSYLHKLKEKISNIKSLNQISPKEISHFQIKNIMNEILSDSCFNYDNQRPNERKFSLLDNDSLKNFSLKTEISYASDISSMRDINN